MWRIAPILTLVLVTAYLAVVLWMVLRTLIGVLA